MPPGRKPTPEAEHVTRCGVSLDQQAIADLERLQKLFRVGTRSALIRAALRTVVRAADLDQSKLRA